MTLDEVNYSILKTIQDHDGPLWKNRIHESLKEREPELPEMNGVSVQTVGRRVDRLRDEGLLDSCIISPDGIKRDLIIAFKLTGEGEQALAKKREEFLKHTVQQMMFSDDATDLSKSALVELMKAEFELDDETKSFIATEYTKEELSTLLAVYYVKQRVVDVFDDANMDKFADLAGKSEKMADAISQGLLSNEIAEKLG